MRYLPPESDSGNIEYKLTLSDKNENQERIEELASQMRYRLFEGNGEAIYYIGVTDDGIPLGLESTKLKMSLQVLKKVADIAGARTRILREAQGEEGTIAEIFVVREKNPNEIPNDIRIASTGNVDAGKSTLIGVLLRGELDDGRGAARSNVVRYLHELESGRTSSVSVTVIGYDVRGDIVTHDKVHPPTDLEILERSIKTITFFDLAGHERYLKTTVFGLTGLQPNFGMLVVAANQGILPMTKEHLGLLIALRIPFFVVLTKVDMTPAPVTKKTIESIKKILKIPGVSKIPMMIDGLDDVVLASRNIYTGNVIPVFSVSNNKGTGLEYLQNFLRLLPIKETQPDRKDDPFKAYIDDIYSVSGVGTVVTALVYSGTIAQNDFVQIGPFGDGSFKKVRVKSIQYKRVPTSKAKTGKNYTFALARFKKSDVRKGMILLGMDHKPGSVLQFEADVYVLYHSTTIKKGYSPVVHVQSIRQSARIINIDRKYLRTGDKAKITFEFMYRPEYIQEGSRVVFREGRTRGIGIITKLLD